MNVMKNMEAIFLVALALACATSYATAAVPAIHADHGARVTLKQTSVDGQPMQVITVTAKRLSAAEKDRI
jgi:type IV pilus biogenesis protein CpaD/CtpE